LNLRPSGYEPDELPDCSTPRCDFYAVSRVALDLITLRVMSPTSYRTAPLRDINFQRGCSMERFICYHMTGAESSVYVNLVAKSTKIPENNKYRHRTDCL